MPEQVYGAKLTADAGGYVASVGDATKAQAALNDELGKSQTVAKSTAAEAKAFVDRLKEQADTLGKTRAETERYRAGQQQLSDAQREGVKASIDQIAAYDKKQAALTVLRTGLVAVTAAVVAYGAATLVSMKGIVDSRAELHNLSQSIGISTESLSAYRYQMSLVGVGQEEFGMSMKTLARNTAEAAGGFGNGSAVLRLLGGDILNAAQQGASLEQLLPQIADAFSRFADGPNKSALALMLFGRAGEQMIPLLNQGSAGFRAAAREAEEFNRIVGVDAAKSADEFNANLVRMNALLSSQKQILANDLLPVLASMVQKYIEARREGEGFFSAAVSGLRGGVTDTAAAQRVLATSRDPMQIQAELAAIPAGSGLGSSARRRALQQELERITNARALLAVNEPGYFKAPLAAGAGGAMDMGVGLTEMYQQQAPTLPGPHQQFMAGAQASAAELDHEIRSSEKLTEAQKTLIALSANYAAGLTTLTAKQFEDEKATLRVLSAKERLLLNRQRDIEIMAMMGQGIDALTAKEQAQVDVITSAARAHDEQNRQLALEIQLTQSEASRTGGAGFSMNRYQQIQIETRLMAENNAEREKALAFRQLELKTMQDYIALGEIVTVEDQKRVAQLFALADAQKASLGALIDAKAAAQQSRDAAQATRREWDSEQRRMADSVQGTLSHALITGFMNGSRSGAEALKQALIASMATLVLEPMLKPILMPFAQFGASLSQSMFGTAGMAGAGATVWPGFGAAAGGTTYGANTSGLAPEDLYMTGGLAQGGTNYAPYIGGAAAIGGAYAASRAGPMSGAVGGAMAGAYIGSIVPGIGTAIGAVIGGALGYVAGSQGGGEGKSPTLQIVRSPSGYYSFSQTDLGLDGPPIYAQMQALLNDRTKYNQADLASLAAQGALGVTGEPGANAQQLVNVLMQRIAGSALPDMATLTAQQGTLEQQLFAVKGSLSGSLGIDSLSAYRKSLDVSGLSGGPMDQLSAARTQYEDLLGRARGGDLGAIGELQNAASSYLNIGRSVYASGGDFQGIYGDVTKALDEVIGKQQATMTDLLKDFPAVVKQGTLDTTAAIRTQTSQLLDAFNKLQDELARVRAAIAT